MENFEEEKVGKNEISWRKRIEEVERSKNEFCRTGLNGAAGPVSVFLAKFLFSRLLLKNRNGSF